MIYSVEVDNSNPLALGYCLKKMENNIPDFDEWSIEISGGGVDYGVYLNIDVDRQNLEISNQPRGNGEDSLDDVFELYEEEDDDYEDEDE